LLTWHGKSDCHISKNALSRQQKGDFADVAVTFSLPRKQKNQQKEVKQNCQHCRGHSKKKLQEVKQNTPTL
jgi:hypothetical protein